MTWGSTRFKRRLIASILALPAMALVVIPATLVWRTRTWHPFWGLSHPYDCVLGVLAVALIVTGLTEMVATIGLFARVGRGTLAPWDPPHEFVCQGLYRYVRNPMITSVAAILAGETAVLGSLPVLGWLVIFVTVNALYIPFFEEPQLLRRFGQSYADYRATVPRWVPGRRRSVLGVALILWLSVPTLGQENAPPSPPNFPADVPPKVQPALAPNLSGLNGRPWSTQLKPGWNLVAFPGQVDGPVSGLAYALVDATSNRPVPGAPVPWRAYWAYSESDSIVSAALIAAPPAEKLDLSSGWNALVSPLQVPKGIAMESAPTYGQCFTGDLGNFKAQPFQNGFMLEPGRVVWVYAYRPCQLALRDSSGSQSAMQGQVVDNQGQAISHASVVAKWDGGRMSARADAWGRFSLELPPQAQQGALTVRVSAAYFALWQRTFVTPVTERLAIHLTRKLSTLDVAAFTYHWGAADYRPYSVVIYPQGQYYRARTQWFPRYQGRCDTYIKYFPQGPYRMVITWRDRAGYEQTLTRDGVVNQAFQIFLHWNSWNYS